MKLSSSLLISVLLVLVACCSCDWDITDNSDEARGVSGYPISDGSEWIYAIAGHDEIKYVIDGVYNHPETGDTYVLQEYTYDGYSWDNVGTYYLEVNENAVRLYIDDESDYFYRLLAFPVYPRANWVFFDGVTATVTDQETLEVPAGTFDTYKIEYSGDIEFTLWYSPDIGCWGVKNYGWWLTGGEPATIELSTYDIP